MRLKSFINPLSVDVSHSRKMSVDVFGRQLNKSVLANSRGPPGRPGIGFKTTASGDYDLEGKRLCNVGEPKEPNDAATVTTLHKKSHNNIKFLRKEINESNLLLVQGLEANIQNIAKTLNSNLETVQDLTIRNSNLISQLDTRLNALEKKNE